MKDFINTETYKNIIKNKPHVFFVSPHLDDAIFSAGGLMNDLNVNGVPTTLINVFTKPSKGPYSMSVKRFMLRCGYQNAEKLYKERLLEDREAAKKVGAKVINLGFVDALWRRKGVNGLLKSLSNVLPELDYVYPVFKLSLAFGKISFKDVNLVSQIANKITKITCLKKDAYIFIPVATGPHIDHKVVRKVGDLLGNRVVYWADYPYVTNFKLDKKFVKQKFIHSYEYKISKKSKESLVKVYRSQIKAIFNKDNGLISMNEIFYL